MRKLFALAVLLVLGVAVLGPSQGQAFNSGTHIYIAERVFPFVFDKINLNYGSIAPDLSSYVGHPEDWLTAFCDTHYKPIKLPDACWNITQRAFAKGWQTHNEIWAADSYAHGTCQNYDNCSAFWNCSRENCNEYCTYDGYVPTQAGALAYKFHLFGNDVLRDNPDLAHFAIEVAIDILLARYHEPGLGLKLRWAAKYRSQEDFNLMLQTFVTDGGPSRDTLQEAEDTFREIVIAYANALSLPDPLRMIAISELGVQIAAEMGVDIDPVEVWWILRVAMDLCQKPNDMGVDYMEVIESAIQGIRTNNELIK
jgi:hypothetical protein